MPRADDVQGDGPRRAQKTRGQKWFSAAVAIYALAIIGLWLFMVTLGDRQWLATLALFGPRWVCALPLPALVLLAAIWFQRELWRLGLVALLIVGPVVGFQIHWPRWSSAPARLRVLSLNVEEDPSIRLALLQLIQREQIDLVALQEAKLGGLFIWPKGWHVLYNDELVLASRWPIAQSGVFIRPGVPDKPSLILYTVRTPNGEFEIGNVHFETPRWGVEAVLNIKTGLDLSRVGMLEEVIAQRASELEEASRWIARHPGASLVVGDFNTLWESATLQRYWGQWTDAFASTGWGLGFTKISEKRGWSYGSRIDHILYRGTWRARRCWVAEDVGSDHLPLVAEFY